MEESKDASRMRIHRLITEVKPKPELCERCRERPITELSYDHSLTEEQKLNPDNYQWLCKSCHSFKDKGSGAIMTKARIHRIRESYKCGAATQRDLAHLFKVDRATIADILHYRRIYQKRSYL